MPFQNGIYQSDGRTILDRLYGLQKAESDRQALIRQQELEKQRKQILAESLMPAHQQELTPEAADAEMSRFFGIGGQPPVAREQLAPASKMVPASFDAESALARLYGVGDLEGGNSVLAAQKAIASMRPDSEKWMGSTITDTDGNVWGVTEKGWRPLGFKQGLTQKEREDSLRKEGQDKFERDKFYKNFNKPERVTGSNGQVYWLQPGQQLPDGITAASSSSGGQPTEGERNAAGFYGRMRESASILDSLEPTGKPTLGTTAASSVPIVGGYIERKSMTPDQQRYKNAADAWIRAKLRKESGAAIGKDEAESEYKTYFPVVGDDKATVAQKAKLRAEAAKEMRISGGRAIENSPQKLPAVDVQQPKGQMRSMPSPAQNVGRTIRDTSTGITYKSDGKQWMRVK